MSISFIDVNNRNKPKLSLCKPNLERTKIGNLKDIYNEELAVNEGALNTLSFTMPINVERNNQLVINPLIDKFNGLYQVRVEWNGVTEYFVNVKENRTTSKSGKEYNYQLMSLGHLLGKKIIRGYEETYGTLTHLAFDMLADTDWTVGFVDVDFDLKDGKPNERGFEVSESTVLQCLFDLATKFGALIEWDTVNLKVNFVKPENATKNKGFKIRDGIFLEDLNAEINYDEIVTRLYVYGQDGLEFRRLTPTGSNYIESYEWFMYPFEYEEIDPPNEQGFYTGSYNVIKSSNNKYFTDELCVKLKRYEHKISILNPTFETLTNQRTSKLDELQQREQELSVLETQLNVYLNERDVINATYMDEAPLRQDWQTVIANINQQDNFILAKLNEIILIETEIESIDNDLANLRKEIQKDSINNFTSDDIVLLNKFTFHKTYTNDSISDEQDLLDDGLRAFKEFNVPPTTLNISIVNFLQDFEFEKIHNRIAIGDTVRAKIKELDLDLSMRINSIKYNFDSDSISLTVTNLKDLRDDWQKFLEKIYTASNTSTTVDMSKHLWNTVSETNTTVDKILNSEYDTSKNILLGGVHSTIEISDRGIYNRDVNNPDSYMVMNGGVIAWTNDGGNTISASLSSRGIHADKIVGKMILSNKMWIESESGLVTIENEAITIKDTLGTHLLTLGRYELDGLNKHGLLIKNGAIDLRTHDNPNRGLQLDENGIRTFNNNGVKTFDLNSISGHMTLIGAFTIKTSDSSLQRVEMTSTGITGYGNSGQITFELNADSGKTTIQTHFLIQTNKESNRGVKITEDGIYGYNLNGDRSFTLNANTGSAYFSGDINASNITGAEITGSTIRGTDIIGNTITGGTISGTDIIGNNIEGGTITGTTITGSDLIGGTLNIGNGAFKVDSDGTATMTKANIQTTPSDGMYVKIHGSVVEGGNLNYGASYKLGTVTTTLGSGYRAGALQLEDYNSDTSSTINRSLQLLSNTIMFKGSNLVIGGASESRPTVITRTVKNNDHTRYVDSEVALLVDGDVRVTGSVLSGYDTLVPSDTPNMSIGYSSATGRFYVKVDGYDVGYIVLENI